MNLRGMPSSYTTEDAVNLTRMVKGYGQMDGFRVYLNFYFWFTFKHFSHY